MQLSSRYVRFVVRNSHFTLLFALSLVAAGLLSLESLNVSKDPDIPIPQLKIYLYLPGASAVQLQREAVIPVEAELKNAGNIKRSRTIIGPGVAVVYMEFEFGADLRDKRRDVESRINNISHRLPETFEYRVYELLLSESVTSFFFAVVGQDVEPERLRHTAWELASLLRQVPSLKNIEVAQPDQAVIVNLDPVAIQNLGVGVAEVSEALRAYNTSLPTHNEIIGQHMMQIVPPQRSLREGSDLLDAIVFSDAGAPVPLRLFAAVERRFEGNRASTARYNGEQAVLVQASIDPSNVLHVSKAVDQALAEFEKALTPDIRVEKVFDQSERTRQILSGLAENLLYGMIIVFAVLLVSMGVRAALIVSSVLPLSLVAALSMLLLAGFGIEQASLAGFLIALGMIVDNGIVLAENTYNLEREQGLQPDSAAIAGTAAAVSPLISANLSTMLAFAPVFFLTTNTGLYLRSMTASIWFALLSALLLSLTLSVLLLARFGTARKVPGLPRLPSVLDLLRPVRDRVYWRALGAIARFRLLALLCFLVALGYALTVAKSLPVILFPSSGDPYMTINLDFPDGGDDQTQRRVTDVIEQRVREHPDVESVTMTRNVAFPTLVPGMIPYGDAVFLLRMHSSEDARLATAARDFSQDFEALAPAADITVNLMVLHDTWSGRDSDLTLLLSGSDPSALQDALAELAPILGALPGVERVRDPTRTQQHALRMHFLEDKAAALGVPRQAVIDALALRTHGRKIGRFRDHLFDEHDLYLRLAPPGTASTDYLLSVSVPNVVGDMVPLAEVVRIELDNGQAELTHKDFRPSIELGLWFDAEADPSALAAKVEHAVAVRPLPPGISVTIGGSLKGQSDDFSGFGRLTALFVFLILTVFVLQFRSFSQPLIILSAVPFCLIGALLSLQVTGLPLSFIAAVGIASLVGIVVNDSILLVEHGNRLLREDSGRSVLSAGLEAGRARFMPVVLTSVTTIAGLTPMALGSTMFQPLAVVVIGGMLSSTLLVLVLVPILFIWFSPGSASRVANAEIDSYRADL